jgi:hypothetical protein
MIGNKLATRNVMNNGGLLKGRYRILERPYGLRVVRNVRISLPQLGLAAIVLAGILTAVGFVIYGNEMGPHFIAVSIGILGEVTVVVLVLDRMASSQKMREWSFVESVVSHGVSACMVDLLRLCGVRWSPASFARNGARYEEFVRIARLHLANLRSNLEGLALGAEPERYEQARRIELRLAWLTDYLSQIPDGQRGPGAEYEIILSTMRLTGEFLQATSTAEFRTLFVTAGAIVTALGEIRSPQESDRAADKFWDARMRAQNEMLRLNPALGTGILYDIDQALAPVYFAIDYALWSSFDE